MERRRNIYEQFCRLSVQLNSALKTRGGPILHPANAEISVKQFETLITRDVSKRLEDLSALLRMAHSGEEPLSLTVARTVYSGCLQDTLCSVLGRLQWRQFCTQADAIATNGRGCMLADCALDCVFEALSSWEHVQPSSDAETAKSDVFARYTFLQDSSAHHLSCTGLVNCCVVSRFQSLAPFVHQTVLALIGIKAAVAQAGARAHAGNLVLAKLTSSLQKARPASAQAQSSSTADTLLVSSAYGAFTVPKQQAPFASWMRFSLCFAQILREGAKCTPDVGASFLSVDYVWRQLVPDLSALVRSLCVAVEAWPRGVPKPTLFPDLPEGNLHDPLGLQIVVRPHSHCSAHEQGPPLILSPPGKRTLHGSTASPAS